MNFTNKAKNINRNDFGKYEKVRQDGYLTKGEEKWLHGRML